MKRKIFFDVLKFSIKNPKIGIRNYLSAHENAKPSEDIEFCEKSALGVKEILESIIPSSVQIEDYEKEIINLKDHLLKFTELIENKKWPSKEKPYDINYSIDFITGLFLYALVRITKPEIVIETGVAYGFSSSFILQALENNKKGTLYSFDYVFYSWQTKVMIGKAIPDNLRNRWKLIFGPSSVKLPHLLELISPDIFLHDSEHTYKNMIYEFELVLPYLKKNGFILSDDILSNNAFHEFYTKQKLTPYFLKQEGRKQKCLNVKKFFGIVKKYD